jgi:hypothetical protein
LQRLRVVLLGLRSKTRFVLDGHAQDVTWPERAKARWFGAIALCSCEFAIK